MLARAEVAAVFHRKLREKDLAPAAMREVRAQFDSDCRAGLWRFLPIGMESITAVAAAYARLPANLFLRSADCIHLVAARMAGCGAIYSSDRHVLAAAARFGLDGIDVVPSAP